MANKNNKVYYGEYSLDRWIKLVLTKKIVLPPYQRYFVWTEKQTARLLKSIEKYQYLPAVTIGACEDSTTHKRVSVLLDGQQRLTSVLLACLGKFPKVKKPDERLKYVDEVEGQMKTEWKICSLNGLLQIFRIWAIQKWKFLKRLILIMRISTENWL